MMWIGVLTLFPEMFDGLRDYGICSRALEQEQASLHFWNPRDYSQDRHKRVDDRPFGGGPGMVMQAEPLYGALLAAKAAAKSMGKSPKVIYLSPQGKTLQQNAVKRFASMDSLILIAGRYEGIDERFIEAEVDEEWSIGDYVLSGGELAAMVLIDAVLRQLPGVLGHEESAIYDSFAEGNQGLLDCPHYTRPETVLGKSVPEVLLSGNHEHIRRWRLQQSLYRTRQRRPDILDSLLEAKALDKEVLEMLEQLRKA